MVENLDMKALEDFPFFSRLLVMKIDLQVRNCQRNFLDLTERSLLYFFKKYQKVKNSPVFQSFDCTKQ
jgi:hypothetical protein